MMYLVATDGRRGGVTLFLVDRSKNKKAWWTTTLVDAMVFRKESAANIQRGKLSKNNPRVVPIAAAQAIVAEQSTSADNLYDEHPFSSEGLGQS